MDIGKDVLTKTIIGTTDAEKVFTPWWITLHHYLVYTLVVLGIFLFTIKEMFKIEVKGRKIRCRINSFLFQDSLLFL